MSKTAIQQNDWREVTLGEIVEVKNGYGFRSKDYVEFTSNELEVLKMGHIERGGGLRKNPKRDYVLRDKELERWILDEGDIVMAMTDMKDNVVILGVSALIDKDNQYVLNQRVARLKLMSEDVDLFFLSNYLRWNKFVSILQSKANSGVQVNLTTQAIKDSLLHIPPLPEQKAIAEVFSSLDDKIDLLHRQNKTLEDMAQALFRTWFVEGADERWEEKSLGEVVDCVNGVSYKSSQLKSSPNALVTLKSFDREGGFRMDGFKEFIGKYKGQQVVNEGDLVVAHTDITQDGDIIGNPVLVISNPVYKTMIISMDLVKVNPKYGWLSKEFLYSLMKTREFKFYCLGNSNGSTVLHLSKSAIPTYQFKFPPIKLIKEFTENAKSCFDKKFKNISQIHALQNLRNTLLPKLMSGAVRVRFQ